MSKPTLIEKWFKEASGFSIQKAVAMAKNDNIRGDNAAILAKWMPKWGPQMAANYARIKDGWGVKFLSDAARGLPAVVVGIGPSLDDEIEMLRFASEQAILIATDASLRVLARHEIRPHLVLQLDCKAENVTMFDHVDTRDLVLVANSCISPVVLNAWKGKVIFYNMSLQDSEFMTHVLPYVFPQFGAMDSKATVGNLAVLLAHLMGCSRVIAVGMDLCYRAMKAEGVYRYRCTDYAWSVGEASTGIPAGWSQTENKVLYDNDDRLKDSFDLKIREHTYRVDHELEFYRKALLDMVGTLGIEFTNTAVEGVLREDLETMPLEEAFMKYCQPAFGPGESVVPHLAKLIPDLPPIPSPFYGDLLVKTVVKDAPRA